MFKKKYLNIYLLYFWVVLLGMFFIISLSNNCYAFTENEYNQIISDCYDLVHERFPNSTLIDFDDLHFYNSSAETNYNNFIQHLSSYNYFYSYYGGTTNNNIKFVFFENISEPIQLNSYNRYSATGSSVTLSFNYSEIYCTYNGNVEFIYYDPTTTLNLYWNFDFKDKNNILHEFNYIITHDTITLTAQKSGAKFTFNDKDQLKVDLTGDYNISDFSFYVERYIDNNWEIFTDINDYYRLSGYNNPYYIFWNNLNYFPTGTYRYMADYLSLGIDLFYSGSFTITDSVINNEGTGTIDNGNIDINIDTGQTVDSIKDYLGSPADISEEEFASQFPEVDIEDPSEDFFTWVFTNIENIFKSTSEQTFSFSLYTNTTYTISSNQIFVPSGVIKTLIGLFCDFTICYWIIKDVRKVIVKIRKGSIEAIAEEDITANMV